MNHKLDGEKLNPLSLCFAYFHHTQLSDICAPQSSSEWCQRGNVEIDQNDGIILAHEFPLLIIFRWFPSIICNLQNTVSVWGYSIQYAKSYFVICVYDYFFIKSIVAG